MPALKQRTVISEQDYLTGELDSGIKHQLINGEAFAMAGASVNHDRISTNLIRHFANKLDSAPCEPFGSDMKVKTNDNFFYPDVIVDSTFDETTPYYTQTPKIIVEVLSKSTRRIDETVKRSAYIGIESLQEYILIEQDIVDVEVIRREQGWVSEHYFMGDDVTFTSIGLTLSVADIYQRVKNDDVQDYLDKLAQETETIIV